MNPNEVVSRLETGSARIEACASWSEATLTRAYAPGKWTARQILSHLADCELVYLYRFLKTIGEPGSPIVPFDQDKWVAELGGAERPAALSILVIRACRAWFIWHLENTPREALLRTAHHPERGELTAIAMAAMIARHAEHHMAQLDAIRDGRVWAPEE